MFTYRKRTVPSHRVGGKYSKAEAPCLAIWASVGSFIAHIPHFVKCTFILPGLLFELFTFVLILWSAWVLLPIKGNCVESHSTAARPTPMWPKVNKQLQQNFLL